MKGQNEMLMVYADGGTTGHNPAKSIYWSAAVYRDGILVKGRRRKSKVFHTNNEAEWMALAEALYLIRKHQLPGEQVIIHMDSNLVVQQFTGQWKVKNVRLKVLHQMVCRDIPDMVTVIWVPREKNVRILGH